MPVASWYHANVKSISRGKSKTYVGLVAYVTGKKLQNPETGRQDKRNHPGDVVSWGIVAPPWAPTRFTDKAQIEQTAQEVQASERRANAQFSNHWDIALWRHATPEQHEALAKRIAERYVERYGTLVVYAIHAPSGEGSEHNWHLYLAPNMRRITETGFGKKATEITDGKTRVLETEWVRRMIAEETNEFLKSVNSDERVSHQSYRQRGILKEATVHLGNNAWQAEKRGERTQLGDKNRRVRADNDAHDAEQAKSNRAIERLEADIIDLERRRITLIAEGKHPMELTPGQAARAVENFAEGFEKAADNYDKASAATLHNVFDNAESFLADNKRQLAEAEKRRQEDERDGKNKRRDQDITDPVLRWKQALERPMDGDNPFRMMAAAARSEGSAFAERQEQLRRDEAKQALTDPDKAEITKKIRHVEAAEYMAFTSERLVQIARINTGRKGSESEEKYQDDAYTYRQIAKEEREQLTKLRDAYEDKAMGKVHEGMEQLKKEAREDPWGKKYTRPDKARRRISSTASPSRCPRMLQTATGHRTINGQLPTTIQISSELRNSGIRANSGARMIARHARSRGRRSPPSRRRSLRGTTNPFALRNARSSNSNNAIRAEVRGAGGASPASRQARAGGRSRQPASLRTCAASQVPTIAALWRGASIIAYERGPARLRPKRRKRRCHEQEMDYRMACRGAMSWQACYAKWGHG